MDVDMSEERFNRKVRTAENCERNERDLGRDAF